MSVCSPSPGRITAFFAKVRVPADVEACWEWTGAKSAIGYGTFWDGHRQVRPHRFALEIEGIEIPFGFQVDHLCFNRYCVNPLHLEAVTPRENVLRSHGISAELARRTHCRNGHELIPENCYAWRKDRARVCKRCSEAYKLAWKRAKRERERQGG